MTKIVRAKDLKFGDEFMFQGELYRVTLNESASFHNEERKIWTYVVERPRTAPFIIWWANDQEVQVENSDDTAR
jgi:hypothetical protein